MTSRLRLFLLILVIPVASSLMAWGARWRLDASLRESVRRDYPAISSERLAGLTVSGLAAEGGFSRQDTPLLYRRLGLVIVGSLSAGLLGLVLVAAIHLAGRASLRHRDILLRWFKPGLYVTLVSVGLLTLLQSLCLAYAASWFGRLVLHFTSVVLAAGVALGGIMACVAVGRAIVSVLRRHEVQVFGQAVTEAEQPQLWGLVREVCKGLGAEPPDHLVLGLEPGFYVTESELLCGGSRLRGRTLFLSLCHARVLTPYELKAVIGHEMAHFIGEDTTFTRRFFPVYRGTYSALGYLTGQAVHLTIVIAQMPAVAFLSYFLESFLTAERSLSRRRETEADAVGARVAGADNLATSLVKVHAHGESWGLILKGVACNEGEFRNENNFARCFSRKARACSQADLLRLGEHRLPHPTDSHPPLAQRLEALGLRLESVAPLSLLPEEFQGTASALIVDVEALEFGQSQALRALLRSGS